MTSKEFFEIFLFPANWDFELNLVFIGVSIAYLLLTGPYRRWFPNSEPVPGKTKMFFLFAMIVYYFALGSPIRVIAAELFSMHMMQMSLLYFVVPPLLWLGIPAYMIRPLLNIKVIRKLWNFFTKPLISLVVFNGSLSFYHLPLVFEAIMNNQVLHNVTHGFLLFAALTMWWPIISPVKEFDRLRPIPKIGLIFANGFLLTPACAIITFTDIVLFDTYSQMSQLAPIMSPLHDQQFGGVIMKIMQEIVYVTAIILVYTRWVRAERKKEQEELIKIRQENSSHLANA